MSKITYNDRPCEICGQDDLKCAVACSGLGPASFNTCSLCAVMRAEHKPLLTGMIQEGMIEKPCLIPYYDPEIDSYVNDFGPCKIRFKDGYETEKRTEAAVRILNQENT